MSLPPAPAGLVTRELAHRLLTSILRHGQSFGDAVESVPQLNKLEERDRAFVRLLVLLTLRRLGQIDALLQELVKFKTTPAAVVDILRLTAAQLLWLKTPAHAAVDSAVNLAEKLGQTKLKGLVNAVSRKLSTAPVPPDRVMKILPPWLFEAWNKAYGADNVTAMARQQLQEPYLDITVKADPALWAEKLGAIILPTASLRIEEAGRVENLAGYAEGAWWVQDTAATLPARLLGDVRGKTVVDLGAAPGGKTAQLAAAGAKVIAVERDPARAAILKQNLARLKLEAEIIIADATQWKPSVPVDAVLLDAPCTATGTLRRHPEIAWLKDRLDVQKQAKAQAALLKHVTGWLPKGAVLVYAVCSLQPEETEAQITPLLRANPALKREAIDVSLIGGLSQCLTPHGDLLTLPHHLKGGMDGFYAARLRKTA